MRLVETRDRLDEHRPGDTLSRELRREVFRTKGPADGSQLFAGQPRIGGSGRVPEMVMRIDAWIRAAHRARDSIDGDAPPPGRDVRPSDWTSRPLEAIEDHIEAVLELVRVVVAGLHGVLGDEVGQVLVLTGREGREHGL